VKADYLKFPGWAFLTCMVLAVAFVIPRQANAEEKSHANDVLPRIELDRVLLTDAIKNIARVAGINYIIDPRVTATFRDADEPNPGGPVITKTWRFVPAAQALSELLKSQNLVMASNPVTTISRIVLPKQKLNSISAIQFGTDTSRVVPVFLMEYVPLNDAITNIAREASMRITFDANLSVPAARGAKISSILVSIRWENVTVRQALVALLDNYDLDIVGNLDSGPVRIEPRHQDSSGRKGK
jgi:hypothetical protein